MHRLSLILGMIGILLLANGSTCHAQERNFAPYFGGSLSLDTNVDPGWGIEAGLRFFRFYAGLEYGTYAYGVVHGETEDINPDAVFLPEPASTEQFWGIHAGYVFKNAYYLGLVFLRSNQVWLRGPFSNLIVYTNYFLNIGPDLRYSGLDDGHMYLVFAFTIRRGIKTGIGYMF